MTARCYATTFPTPARTGGEDRPAPACQGRPEPYDVLVDQTAGPAFHAALRVARDICGGCPLRDACLTENREEPWARALMGLTRSGAKPKPVMSDARAAANREQYEARLEALREFIDQGLLLEDACGRLHTTQKALYAWCQRHGHADMWHELTPHLQKNQHRKRREMAA